MVEPQRNGGELDIRRVLAGEAAFDDLSERNQAAVREVWDEHVNMRLARLDLAAEFSQAGRSWTEADEQGHAVRHQGDPVPGHIDSGA